jgi:hypothetical protein
MENCGGVSTQAESPTSHGSLGRKRFQVTAAKRGIECMTPLSFESGVLIASRGGLLPLRD